jgi:bifunctional NMN adenylyltransferase/nudix hydrolase
MMTTKQKAEVGVIIARFQTPFLHEGHVDILSQVIAAHPRVIVYLGLSPVKCSKNNPLDFVARKAMIEAKYPNIEVHYIEDVGNNELWSKNLDRHINKIIGPGQKAVLYGGRDSFVQSYMGKFPTFELLPNKFISAREIRKNIGIKSKTTEEFREGVIWAVENQYPSVHPTVDFAIVNEDSAPRQVLLARKPNEELLRFPGGFADVNSPSYEDDVLREAKEETGLVFDDKPTYIGSTLIDDWRYRAEQNKIKTLMFVLKYTKGSPKADDDIADVRWVKFREIDEKQIVPSHRPLIHLLNDYYGNNVLGLP